MLHGSICRAFHGYPDAKLGEDVSGDPCGPSLETELAKQLLRGGHGKGSDLGDAPIGETHREGLGPQSSTVAAGTRGDGRLGVDPLVPVLGVAG